MLTICFIGRDIQLTDHYWSILTGLRYKVFVSDTKIRFFAYSQTISLTRMCIQKLHSLPFSTLNEFCIFLVVIKSNYIPI